MSDEYAVLQSDRSSIVALLDEKGLDKAAVLVQNVSVVLTAVG